MDHKKAYALSFKNRTLVEQSQQCGCFYCEQVFVASAITEWTDVAAVNGDAAYGQTALCPLCGTDAVLPDTAVELTPDLLKGMREEYFGVGMASNLPFTQEEMAEIIALLDCVPV